MGTTLEELPMAQVRVPVTVNYGSTPFCATRRAHQLGPGPSPLVCEYYFARFVPALNCLCQTRGTSAPSLATFHCQEFEWPIEKCDQVTAHVVPPF